jgi:hypothetical protein
MENGGIVHPPAKKKPPTKKKSVPPKYTPIFKANGERYSNGEAYRDAQRKIQEFFSPCQKNVGTTRATTTGLDG